MKDIPANPAAQADKHMRRKVKVAPVGSSPGTLIADPNALPLVMTLTMLSPKKSETIEDATLDDVVKARGKWPLIWLDCAGLGDIALIQQIGQMFNLQPLELEDTVNTDTRPKTEFMPDHAFVIMTMIDSVEPHRYEQVSIYFGDGFVLTFQERAGDPFGPVRKRIGAPLPNRLRQRKSDYLAYALIDAIVDSYFPLVEQLGDKTEQIEDEILDQINKTQARRLHLMRRGASQLRRPLPPIRDAVAALVRAESALIAPDTKIFLNDTLDHAATLIDLVDAQRDMLTGLIDTHLTLSQAKTGEVISFLTIVSSIFIPLTFLAGIWGMNFDTKVSPWNMPELEWVYGYPAALGLMFLIAVALLGYFKWRRWL